MSIHEDDVVCDRCHPRTVIEQYETMVASLRRQLENEWCRAEKAERELEEMRKLLK